MRFRFVYALQKNIIICVAHSNFFIYIRYNLLYDMILSNDDSLNNNNIGVIWNTYSFAYNTILFSSMLRVSSPILYAIYQIWKQFRK